MYSIIKVHAGGENVEFFDSSILMPEETMRGYLCRNYPMVSSFSHAVLNLGFMHAVVFFDSCFRDNGEKFSSEKVVFMKTEEDFIFTFFGDIWIVPFNEKDGNLLIEDRKSFAIMFAKGFNDALAHIDKNGSDELIFPQNIFKPLDESAFGEPKEADVGKWFSDLSTTALFHVDSFVRIMSKAMLFSGVCYEESSVKSLDRVVSVNSVKSFLRKEDYLNTILKLRSVMDTIFGYYAWIAFTYAGVKDKALFKELINPSVAADAIQYGIKKGGSPVVGRMLLARTGELVKLYLVYNFFASYMSTMDEVMALKTEENEVFGLLDNESLMSSLSNDIQWLIDMDEKTQSWFRLSEECLVDILWGTGM